MNCHCKSNENKETKEELKDSIISNINKKEIICYKCKKSIGEYKLRNLYSCHTCILKFIEANFKISLRQYCKINKNENISICISPDIELIESLIHLIENTQKYTADYIQYKNINSPQIQFILVDIYKFFHLNKEIPSNNPHSFIPSNNISFFAKTCQFYIQNTFQQNIIILNPFIFAFPNIQIPIDQIYRLFYQLYHIHLKSTLSFKYLQNIITYRALLCFYNKEHKQDYNSCFHKTVLFTPTCSDIGKDALHLLCEGGGSSIPLESQYLDLRCTSNNFYLRFARPFKTFLNEEIKLYHTIRFEHMKNNFSKYINVINNQEPNKITYEKKKISSTWKSRSADNCIYNFMNLLQNTNLQNIFALSQTLGKITTHSVSYKEENPINCNYSHEHVIFPFGQCYVCMGGVENINKNYLVSTWGKKASEILKKVFNSNEEDLFNEISHLCVRCLRIASTDFLSCQIIYHLYETYPYLKDN